MLNGGLLVVVAVLLLYLAVTGRLNCVIAAWQACGQNGNTQGALPDSPTATPQNAPLPQFKTTQIPTIFT